MSLFFVSVVFLPVVDTARFFFVFDALDVLADSLMSSLAISTAGALTLPEIPFWPLAILVFFTSFSLASFFTFVGFTYGLLCRVAVCCLMGPGCKVVV